MNKLAFKVPFKLSQGYGFPIIVSIFLHIVILGLLTYHWPEDNELKVVPPRNIKASLVEVSAPKPQPPKVQPRTIDNSAQKARERAELKRREEAKRKAEAERRRDIALKKEREAKERSRKEAEARKERERQRKLAEDKRKQQKAEAQRQLEQERMHREQASAAQEQADKDAAEVAYYSGLLQNLIAQNWNRPPSARNNMVAVIQVSFSPYGDLLEVRLLEGSGNEAYDRSVIQAVQRAAPFPELKKLDRRIFNNNFKRINFRFRPEDLVR